MTSAPDNARVHIRNAVESDLPTVAALYEASGIDDPAHRLDAAGLSAAWARLHREAPTARLLLAEVDGGAVGTLTVFVLPLLNHGGTPAAVVEGVAVDPASQGNGVGRALMQAAMEIARDHGCYKLALSSNLKRIDAHAFYDRLGFERHGISFVALTDSEAA